MRLDTDYGIDTAGVVLVTLIVVPAVKVDVQLPRQRLHQLLVPRLLTAVADPPKVVLRVKVGRLVNAVQPMDGAEIPVCYFLEVG